MKIKKNDKKQLKAKTDKKMWDLLIPLLLILCVMPLIVRLHIYHCGYNKYPWFSDNDIMSDFYTYYKEQFFAVVVVFVTIILIFRMVLYKEKRKRSIYYLPVVIYIGMVILSTIFSVNPMASWVGNLDSFENCIVLSGYGIVSFYAYQILEDDSDYKILYYGLLVMSIPMLLVGYLQVAGVNLLQMDWFQKCIMSAEEFAQYGGSVEEIFSGNNVYLTLYNPNYAGVFLVMLSTVALMLWITEKEKKKQILLGIWCVALLILVWFTYSRSTLVALAVVSFLVFLQSKAFWTIKKKRQILAAIGGLLVVFVVFDALNHFKYFNRIAEKNEREPISSMTTDEHGIHIVYDSVAYQICVENDELICSWEQSKKQTTRRENEGELSLPFEDAKALYEKDDNRIVLFLADNMMNFLLLEDGYYYETISGEPVTMKEVEKTDFHGLEYLGSARGYIWSRTVPLLKHYLLIGSGPDTFAEVFPQDDYAGKLVYSDDPTRIIEKGHNDYLTKWVQTGMISLIALVCFYIVVCKAGKQSFVHAQESFGQRFGLGCYYACIAYMVMSMFNDSTLQTAPMFWIFTGVVLSVGAENGRRNRYDESGRYI